MTSPSSPDAAELAALEAARLALERLKAAKAHEATITKARDELSRIQAGRDKRIQQEKDASDAKAKAARAANDKADKDAAYQDFLDAQAALHAQAIAVSNIHAMLPLTLDLSSTNYSKWKALFLNLLGKYELSDHVLADVDENTASSAYWIRMDCAVKSWLFSTITPALLEVIHTGTLSARKMWLNIEEQFVGKCETRALIIDAEFRTFSQGDLNVTDYCTKMKSMADALTDLGELVLDRCSRSFVASTSVSSTWPP